jgi:capsular polysaccharide biosynthesis protein
VKHNDQAAILSLNRDNHAPRWLWAQDDDYAGAEDQSANFNPSLVSLGFIRAAIRRNVRFWGAFAIAGFLIGAGSYLALPPVYQATTQLLLTVGPEATPGTAILDDQAIAQSRPVAEAALNNLGLQRSISVTSFIGSYTATVVTDKVLLITVNASSSNDAVKRAGALAAAFLRYRADQLEAQQKLVFRGLDQQVAKAKQQVASIRKQISAVSAQPPSAAQRAKLTTLRAERGQATSALAVLVQTVNTDKASIQTATISQANGSQVLNAAAPVPPHSRLKRLLLYAAFGLIAGLVLGLGIVVVRAVVSDRLYRRDDVARALGAPVKLSVRTVRLSRWRPGRRGLAAAQNTNVRRISAYLGSTLAANSRGRAALAVVPVDDPQVAAISLVSLAISCVQQMGLRVIVADLRDGAPAARLVGVSQAGIHTVRLDHAQMVVAIPDRDDVAPIGPLGSESSAPQSAACGEKLARAFASADLLLTLATPDPSIGGEHLATWAPAAVAMVTAGRSSWTKINAAGEMVRLAGMRLVSAVLVGADKTDESLGVAQTPGAGRDDAERSFATVDGNTAGGQSHDR